MMNVLCNSVILTQVLLLKQTKKRELAAKLVSQVRKKQINIDVVK
jgi:predicted small secreted protein